MESRTSVRLLFLTPNQRNQSKVAKGIPAHHIINLNRSLNFNDYNANFHTFIIMDQDRVTQAQSEYIELLKLTILHEEAILDEIKEPDKDKLKDLKEQLNAKLKEQEDQFTKKYADLILQGVTFNRDINTISSNHSL